MKRKLIPFFHENLAIYVIEKHVNQIMKLATDGSFSEVKTSFLLENDHWYVSFTYKTNFGKGKMLLKAQEVKPIC